MLRLLLLLIFSVSTSVWDGAYTEEQATRGKDAFEKNCNSCHDLADFSGKTFMDNWDKHTAFDIFDAISTRMPMDRPGELKKEMYADIEAYMFKTNKFPAGTTELPTDAAALKEIKIEPKPGR